MAHLPELRCLPDRTSQNHARHKPSVSANAGRRNQGDGRYETARSFRTALCNVRKNVFASPHAERCKQPSRTICTAP